MLAARRARCGPLPGGNRNFRLREGQATSHFLTRVNAPYGEQSVRGSLSRVLDGELDRAYTGMNAVTDSIQIDYLTGESKGATQSGCCCGPIGAVTNDAHSLATGILYNQLIFSTRHFSV